ncbi:hypothetical protein M433DRAFT_8902 [Acidomyces richmondensis BFW]|nr:hypothetical protein M433DRAFT_8902 [Acidomyces richmondensis BFW]
MGSRGYCGFYYRPPGAGRETEGKICSEVEGDIGFAELNLKEGGNVTGKACANWIQLNSL